MVGGKIILEKVIEGKNIMKLKKELSLCLMSFSCISLCGCSLFVKKYQVTFKNYDGSIIEQIAVKEGDYPTFNGTKPEKLDKNGINCAFMGWDKKFEKIYEDTEYTATFKYKVIFRRNYREIPDFLDNRDGYILYCDYGEIPVYPGDIIFGYIAGYRSFPPVVGKSVLYGWDKPIEPVTCNVEYFPLTFSLITKDLVDYDFERASFSSDIVFDYSVDHIGDYAFYKGKIKESINFRNEYTTIGKFAFAENNLKCISLPNKIETISEGLFEGCFALKTVNNLSNVKEIESSAFSGSAIENISFDSLQKIGDNAFRCCSELKEIHLPTTLLSIGEEAFSCDNFEEIKIPNSVTEIGYMAFYSNNFKSITIPNSVTDLGTSVFHDCIYLEDADIQCDCTSQSMFSGCSSLESVIFNEKIQSIKDYAFYGCSSLSEIKLPSKLKYVERSAFANTAINSLVLPEYAISIGDYSFSNCKSLKDIYIPKSVSTIKSNAFYGCNNIENIYCEASEKLVGWEDGWIPDYAENKITWNAKMPN